MTSKDTTGQVKHAKTGDGRHAPGGKGNGARAEGSALPLLKVMERLLGEGGCPWDREQTHTSLIPYLIEEAYEVVGAIEAGRMDGLREELGDLLLQIVFHAALARREGQFTFDDVVAGITHKMVRRHPHVFGEVEVKDADEVLRRWRTIKTAEKEGAVTSVLAGIPPRLPALMRAHQVQVKASAVGFDWLDASGPLAKVSEELKELREVYASGGEARIGEEIGDLLFSVVNVARFLGVEPEQALARTVDKFTRRFAAIERHAHASGRSVSDLTLEEMDRAWEAEKKRQP